MTGSGSQVAARLARKLQPVDSLPRSKVRSKEGLNLSGCGVKLLQGDRYRV